MTTETQTIRRGNPLTILLTSDWFILVLRVFLGGMLIYSSIHKVQSPDAFAIAIRGYKMLPFEITNLFALSVGWSELVIGLMLILGVMTRQAAAGTFLLLLSFTIAIATTIVRGIAVDCGCFGSEGGDQTGYPLVFRNIFLILGALIVMRFDKGRWSLSSAFGRKK